VEGLFRLDPDNNLKRRPDVAFLSQSRRPANPSSLSAEACDLAPDLAIEVNSPTNTADDLLRKVHEYFKAGVSRVWVVFPSEHEVYAYSSPHQVQIFNLDQSIEDQSLFPGFQLPLKTLFDIQPSTLPLDHGNA
jgi:Uma2 family endonuclease